VIGSLLSKEVIGLELFYIISLFLLVAFAFVVVILICNRKLRRRIDWYFRFSKEDREWFRRRWDG